MKKIISRLATIGTLAVLAATSLGINAQSANAGEHQLRGNVSKTENKNHHKSSRTTAKQMLVLYGLTPLSECTANVVLVLFNNEQICAMPNHIYGPGTYNINPITKELTPFGADTRNTTDKVTIDPPQPTQPQIIVVPSGQTNPQITTVTNPTQPTMPSAANGSIYRLSGQPISPPVVARLRSLLAGNSISEITCGSTPQQVTITVNNDFVVCGHPNTQYAPGNYSFTLNGLY